MRTAHEDLLALRAGSLESSGKDAYDLPLRPHCNFTVASSIESIFCAPTERAVRHLTLHVGLHKTGTTTLQREVLPFLSEYIPGPLGPSPHPGTQSLRTAVDAWARSEPGWEAPLAEFADFVRRRPGDLLLSYEELSAWPATTASSGPLGDNFTRRRHPHPMNGLLARLQTDLIGTHTLRLIVTLRHQSAWLGSLYAQRGTDHARPSSADLATKVQRLVRADDASLDLHGLVNSLADRVGADNLLVLLVEDGIRTNVARIIEFLGSQQIVPDSAYARKRNVRGLGANAWRDPTRRSWVDDGLPRRLVEAADRRTRDTKWYRAPAATALRASLDALQRFTVSRFTLSRRLRRQIRQACRPSNDRLSALMGRDLSVLGY